MNVQAVRTQGGVPEEFTLKAAFVAALNECLGDRDKQDEFKKYTRAIAILQYNHQPGSTGLTQFFRKLEDLRAMQVIVEPNKGAAISYETLINHAHTEIRSGIGGRDDLVQDLLTKWKAQLPETVVDGQDKWHSFRQFYSAKMKEFD